MKTMQFHMAKMGLFFISLVYGLDFLSKKYTHR